MDSIIDWLLTSEEPSLRWKTRVMLLGESPDSRDLAALRNEIRGSPRVLHLLSERDSEGRIPHHVYKKWYGPHWVLADLAELRFPPGDASLLPLRDQVLDLWLSPAHTAEYVPAHGRPGRGVPIVNGLARRCASQEGNALWSILTLGIADERAHQLADNLIRWQWPDGGWNCDWNPAASVSSFHESWIPLRALSLYAREAGSEAALAAASRAAELFLRRRLFRRLRDGAVMNPRFLRLRYPAYWHYGILGALKVLAESGFICDPRCAEALDVLESKRLPGGWPAEEKLYNVSSAPGARASRVDWGVSGASRPNPFVTFDALFILKAAGRWSGA